MLFLLRCVLWLSFVYAAILLPHGAHPGADMHQATRSLSEAAGAKVASLATDYCRDRVSRCLDDAARLTSLISASTGNDAPTGEAKAHATRPRQNRDPIAAVLNRDP